MPMFALILLLIFVPRSPHADATVTIVYTGETHAALKPDEVSPLGGLARRAGEVRRLRSETPDLLLLDAGGAFAGGMYDEGVQGEELDRECTRVILRAMAVMGYDAVCVGDEELGFGPEFLKAAGPEYGLSFLSVNLVRADTGEPFVAPYLLKDVRGVRVAILGVTTPDLFLCLSEGARRDAVEELEIRDPVETVSRYLEEVRDRAES